MKVLRFNRPATLLSVFAVLTLLLAGISIYAQQMQRMQEKPLPPAVEKELTQVRQGLNDVKPKLPELGCCNDPACNYCPLVAGKCPCGMNVKTEVGVCGECKMGWDAGNGRVAGVQATQVRTLNKEMLMMMEKMRVMHFPKGQKQQAQAGEAGAASEATAGDPGAAHHHH